MPPTSASPPPSIGMRVLKGEVRTEIVRDTKHLRTLRGARDVSVKIPRRAGRLRGRHHCRGRDEAVRAGESAEALPDREDRREHRSTQHRRRRNGVDLGSLRREGRRRRAALEQSSKFRTDVDHRYCGEGWRGVKAMESGRRETGNGKCARPVGDPASSHPLAPRLRNHLPSCEHDEAVRGRPKLQPIQ